jgi:hypothetical protein
MFGGHIPTTMTQKRTIKQEEQSILATRFVH